MSIHDLQKQLAAVGYQKTGEFLITINGRRRRYCRVDFSGAAGFRRLSGAELRAKIPGLFVADVKPEGSPDLRFFLVRGK